MTRFGPAHLPCCHSAFPETFLICSAPRELFKSAGAVRLLSVRHLDEEQRQLETGGPAPFIFVLFICTVTPASLLPLVKLSKSSAWKFEPVSAENVLVLISQYLIYSPLTLVIILQAFCHVCVSFCFSAFRCRLSNPGSLRRFPLCWWCRSSESTSWKLHQKASEYKNFPLRTLCNMQ